MLISEFELFQAPRDSVLMLRPFRFESFQVGVNLDSNHFQWDRFEIRLNMFLMVNFIQSNQFGLIFKFQLELRDVIIRK